MFLCIEWWDETASLREHSSCTVDDAVSSCSHEFRGDVEEAEVEVETELGFEKSSTDMADCMHSNFS